MKETLWNDFVRYDFTFKGNDATLVLPKQPAEGKPWIFRAEFFGAFPSADIALCKQGYHIAYIKNSDKFGCDESLEVMREFHDYLVSQYSLNEKTVLFGFSRGGLYSVNYAYKYPEKVAVLYLDAPVLNILSWPAGLGTGIGSEKDWMLCKQCYGLTNGTALSFRGNPIDKAEPLAKLGIPIISVCGDADKTVPYSENTQIFAQRYKAAGGTISVIVKPGVDHHPHSLENPESIIKFIKNYYV